MGKVEKKGEMKLLFVLDTSPDVDGGSIGLRDAIASLLESFGCIRFIGELPCGRVTKREGNAVLYIGTSEYIPCNHKGACLDGFACAGCAHTDALEMLCKFEEAVAALASVTADTRGRRKK